MKQRKSLLTAGFVLVLLFAWQLAAQAAFPASISAPKTSDYSGKTVILHSNNVHGELDGYAAMAALRQSFINQGAEVITIDLGDFSQGGAYVGVNQGQDAITLMNAAGYNFVVPGNHEFDYGYDQLKENLNAGVFRVLCANVLEGSEPIGEPFALYQTKTGLNIGFFGLTTAETQTKANPANIQGLRFLADAELFNCAREQVSALQNAGAEVIIALSHLGIGDEAAPGPAVDLLSGAAGISFMIDGHSAAVATAGENGEAVQSAGSAFSYIGVVVIDDAGRKVEDHYLVPVEGLPKDETVAQLVDNIRAYIDARYNTVIATSEVMLDGSDLSSRTQQTELGELITRAMVWKFMQRTEQLRVPADHVVGIVNGGAIRANLMPGEIKRSDLRAVLPFGNTLAVVYVTGERLLEALEASTYALPEPLGGYPQVCGINFTVNTGNAYDSGILYPNSSYCKPNSIRRVTIQSVNGKPFSPADTYAVAADDFIVAGGDTYYTFSEVEGVDYGEPLDAVLGDYIQQVLQGVIRSSAQPAAVAAVTAIAEPAPVAEAVPETLSPAPAPTEALTAAAPVQPAVSEPGNSYTVQPNDNLWRIAEICYGNGAKWKVIYDANRDTVGSQYQIMPGDILVIPNAGL